LQKKKQPTAGFFFFFLKKDIMINCKLSSLMGERKILKISDVVNATGINRNTLTALYYDRAIRIELSVADKLCKYFDCNMNELFEYTDDENEEQ
jgi:putative transcriptional regulator